MKIVLINGEKLIGKSTLAGELSKELNRYGSGTAGVYSMVEPLERVISEMNPRWRDLNYSDIKGSRLISDPLFPRITGRDVMIQFGNALRGLHRHILCALVMQKAQHYNDEYVIIENWGFPDELEFFRDYATQTFGVEVFTVALTARQKSATRSGEQYPNDNRYRLDHTAQMVDWNMVDILKRLTGDADYPFQDSLAILFPPESEDEEAQLTTEGFVERMDAGTGLTE